MTEVTVIGLGQMGHEVARLLVKAGRSVTIWNRSREKGAALVVEGAKFAPSAAAAVAASPIIVTVLLDAEATRAVLCAEVLSSVIGGRTIIDLGTAGPDDVVALQDSLHARGADLIDGAIQAAPSQMGAPDTPILLASPKPVFERARSVLKILGGGLIYLGEEISSAAFMDLATLSYVYGSFAGFLHGARIVEERGLDVSAYGKIVNAISPSFGAFFEHEAGVIQSGDFTITESPMRISISAMDRIVRESDKLGLDGVFPATIAGWLKDAEALGYGDEELAALIKVLRNRGVGSVRANASAGKDLRPGRVHASPEEASQPL
jgi:3-hydroxyisobutyrate dehydrogenase-like beta-hydroxyacid dehydrogenase